MEKNHSFHATLITDGTKEERDAYVAGMVGDIKSQNKESLMTIEAEKDSISITQIRKIENFLSLKPKYGNYKIVLINEADKMTLEAQNSILKILEEPPNYAKIYLLTKNTSLLLRTIVSRCRVTKIKKRRSLTQEIPQEKSIFSPDNLRNYLNFLEQNKKIFDSKKDALDFLSKMEKGLEIKSKPEHLIIAKKIWEARKLISQTNVNIRLILENIML